MKQINDLDKYLSLMRNGMNDKLFFTDKLFLEWNTFLDFGCADGFLTKKIKSIFPNKEIYGYDEDTLLNTKWSESFTNVHFTNDLESLPERIDVIFLSSVLHEVYSYKSLDEINEFWQKIFSLSPKYIIIRDMAYDEELFLLKEKNIYDKLQMNIFGKTYRYLQDKNKIVQLKNHQEIFGKGYKSLVHFLLKIMYVDSINFDNELKEDFFACSLQEIRKRTHSRFNEVYFENYNLPYLTHFWKENLDIDLIEKTHSKLILINKNHKKESL